MKKNIHPKYNTDVEVECVCGNKFTTGSTKEKLKLEICSNCHSFYTGKQKLIDSSRRVEKFQAKVEAQKIISQERKGKKAKKIIQKQRRQDKEDKK